MIFGSIFTIYGKDFLLIQKSTRLKLLRAPHSFTTNPHRGIDRRGPGVNGAHQLGTPGQGEWLTSRILPSARSPPTDSPHSRELKEVACRANGGVEQALRRQWRRRWRGSLAPGWCEPRPGPRRGA
jgi:hypothetical protein